MFFIGYEYIFWIVCLTEYYRIIVRIHPYLFAVVITNISCCVNRYSQSIIKFLTIGTSVNCIEAPVSIVNFIERDNFKYLRCFNVVVNTNRINAVIFVAPCVYLASYCFNCAIWNFFLDMVYYPNILTTMSTKQV